MSTPVYIESGTKRAFAIAADWPGWARSGRHEQAALDALADYAARYAPVAQRAGVRFPARAATSFEVVQRLKGKGATDFGVPSEVAAGDRRPLTAAQAKRGVAVLEASWAYLADVAATAPATLRKGPRGGGRDRDAIVEHVIEAEDSYARTVGIREKDPVARRAALASLLRQTSDGSPLNGKRWPARYAMRRIAWHVLDHAWEIEDKSPP
jgi:hypothetical protein